MITKELVEQWAYKSGVDGYDVWDEHVPFRKDLVHMLELAAAHGAEQAKEKLSSEYHKMATAAASQGAELERRKQVAPVVEQVAALMQGAFVNQGLLTNAQCDAIYEALDDFARGVDCYDFGLPMIAGGAKETGRTVIRAAIAAAEQQASKPLTDEQLEAIEMREKPLNGPKSMLNFARSIEAAHGITGEKE